MTHTLKFALLGLGALALLSHVDAQNKRLRIGCLTKNSSNPYFLVMIEGCKAAAKKYNVDVVIGSTPTEGAEAEQLGILETWLNQGNFDGFVVTPFRATSLNTGLAKASAKGIPIVNIDELVPVSAAKAANINIAQQISSDNVQAGAVAALTGSAASPRLPGPGASRSSPASPPTGTAPRPLTWRRTSCKATPT